MTTEESLHKAVCNYISLQYPKVLFNTDLSGIKLSIGQAKKIKNLRSSRAFPDIQIIKSNGNHHGLFIELKISSFHKEKGNNVEWLAFGKYDKTYISKIFTFSNDYLPSFAEYGV